MPRAKLSRETMPSERQSITHKFFIRSQDEECKGYITVGFYEDGRVGEIFLKMDKQGSRVSGFADCWSIAVSIMLQSGVPLAEICSKFKGTAFEPSGLTGNPEIHFARSPVDYVARFLEMRFIKKDGAK